MALRTVIATGNYSDGLSVFDGIPQSGDQIYNPGFILTFDISPGIVFGSSTQDNDVAIYGEGAGSGFVISAGVTVRTDGSFITGGLGSYIELNNDSVLSMESAYNGNLALGTGTGSGQTPGGALISNATDGHWATIDFVNYASPISATITTGVYYSERLYGSYVRVNNASQIVWGHSCIIDHWIFNSDCGNFEPGITQNANRDASIDNCSFLSTNQTIYVSNAANFGGTGLRSFTGNIVLCEMRYNANGSGGNYDYSDCLFHGDQFGGTGFKGTFTRCLFNVTSTAVPNFRINSIIDCYFYVFSGDNPHFFGPQGGYGDVICDGLIFEHLGTNIRGDCILGDSTATTAWKLTIKNCICLPDTAGGDSGTLFSLLGNAFITLSAFNNTHNKPGATGETYGGYAGIVSEFYNNIAYGGEGLMSFEAPAVTGVIADANYNSAYGISDPYDLIANADKYQTTPGQNDLNTNPEFFDSSRDLAKWAVDRCGSIGATEADQHTDAFETLAAINDSENPVYIADATIADFFSYIRKGFTPQNLNYLTAGIGGSFEDYIGAVTPEVFGWQNIGLCGNISQENISGLNGVLKDNIAKINEIDV
jgi:hypothetical protein